MPVMKKGSNIGAISERALLRAVKEGKDISKLRAKDITIKEFSRGDLAVKKILEPIAQNILNTAALLKPFMPDIAEKIVKQFSARQIKKGQALFPRIQL